MLPVVNGSWNSSETINSSNTLSSEGLFWEVRIVLRAFKSLKWIARHVEVNMSMQKISIATYVSIINQCNATNAPFASMAQMHMITIEMQYMGMVKDLNAVHVNKNLLERII